MHLTVAICTWNRASLLDQTLTEMQKLRIPEGLSWELLVVNNRCTDNTDAVLERHSGALPLRRLFEPKQGHSNARNCAVSNASGDVLVWTDDDVLVDPEWLAEYALAISANPDVSIFGGPISPWFEGNAPDWLLRVWPRVANAYAIRDLGEQPVEFNDATLPFGANFAIRLAAQREYPFDPTTGRNGKGMLGADETTVIRAMLRDGHRGLWAPKARVRHYIPSDRQTIHYLRRFFDGQGQILAREQTWGEAPKLFGKPRWLVKAAMVAEMRYRMKRMCCRPEAWIEDLIVASRLSGQLQGCQSSDA
jgi:glycosyltransferase involved in cell wall biosynthesis